MKHCSLIPSGVQSIFRGEADKPAESETRSDLKMQPCHTGRNHVSGSHGSRSHVGGGHVSRSDGSSSHVGGSHVGGSHMGDHMSGNYVRGNSAVGRSSPPSADALPHPCLCLSAPGPHACPLPQSFVNQASAAPDIGRALLSAVRREACLPLSSSARGQEGKRADCADTGSAAFTDPEPKTVGHPQQDRHGGPSPRRCRPGVWSGGPVLPPVLRQRHRYEAFVLRAWGHLHFF